MLNCLIIGILSCKWRNVNFDHLRLEIPQQIVTKLCLLDYVTDLKLDSQYFDCCYDLLQCVFCITDSISDY